MKTYIIKIKGKQFNIDGYLHKIVRDGECTKNNAWGITNVVWARDITEAMVFQHHEPWPVIHELADYHAQLMKRQMCERGIFDEKSWMDTVGHFNSLVVFEEYKPESYWNETHDSQEKVR